MRLFAACLITATALAGSGESAIAAPTELTPTTVENLISANLGTTRLPGVAVAITRGDEVIHVAGYGHTSGGTPVTKDTPMRIGSVSKSFTALAMMQLVDAGRVALDEPAATYLPEFSVADPRGSSITVRQLLNHTSGLSDNVHPESSIRQPESLSEVVANLRSVTLDSDPGSTYHYHNPNYQVAARIVEVVSEQAFEDYLNEHIFGPAGMGGTTAVANYAEGVPNLEDGYNRWFGLNVARGESDRFVMGSAGIVSTATDLASWLVVQGDGGKASNGRQLLPPEAVRTMHTATDAETGAGLGWDSISVQGVDQITHNGTSFTYTAEVRLLPESGYGFAVLTNTRQPLESETEAIMTGLIDLSRGQPFDTTAPAAFYWDLMLIAACVVGIGLLVWRIIRFNRGGSRRGIGWKLTMIAAPTLTAASMLAFLPILFTSLTRDREVTWTLIWHLSPTLPMSLAIVATTGALAMVLQWRSCHPDREAPAGRRSSSPRRPLPLEPM